MRDVGGIQRNEPALVDHGDPVAEHIGFEHVMGGQQDGLTLGLQVADHLAELARADRIQPDGRLVEEQHRGVMQQGAGDMEALFHSARVAFDALAAAILQPDQLEQVGDALFGEVGVDMVEAGEVAQVVVTGKPPVQAALAAEDEADLPLNLAGSADDIEAEDAGFSGSGEQQGGEHLDRGGLAGAVWAEKTEELACGDAEGDVVDGDDLFASAAEDADGGAEEAAKMLDFDCVHLNLRLNLEKVLWRNHGLEEGNYTA